MIEIESIVTSRTERDFGYTPSVRLEIPRDESRASSGHHINDADDVLYHITRCGNFTDEEGVEAFRAYENFYGITLTLPLHEDAAESVRDFMLDLRNSNHN